MSETTPDFLRQRSRRSYLHFLRAIQSISPEEALRDAAPGWPDHPWGVGQDGSIAGIVYHVAAWKELTLDMLQPGGRFLARDAFDPARHPAANDWSALVSWYRQCAEAWQKALDELSDIEFDALREWEGVSLSVSKLCVEMMEHDIYHLGQIEYLKQRLAYETK